MLSSVNKLTNVALANFLRNLNVSSVDGSKEQAAVEAELHVRSSGSLSAGGGDVLTEVGCGNKNLGKGNGVVGKEVKLKVFLGIWVGVDDAGDVDNEADCLSTWSVSIRSHFSCKSYQFCDVIYGYDCENVFIKF